MGVSRNKELRSQLSLEEQWEPHMVPARGHTVCVHACSLESQTAATLRMPGSTCLDSLR